jgi:regulator of sigma E protease
LAAATAPVGFAAAGLSNRKSAIDNRQSLMDLFYILNLALLVFGFGFVIFWHELGHFLAAKWAGVRVEQFAVGFGQALVSWRKGIGVRFGSTRSEYERRANEHLKAIEGGLQTTLHLSEAASPEQKLVAAADHLGLGETEYRLNWMPLGGYVKMLGQDDLNPAANSPDPRSYTNKPVGKRMVIVSAGVIMNVILAAVLFMVLFKTGFDADSPRVGGVVPGSPAQLAGLQVGDEIVQFNGHTTHDFNKVMLNSALAPGSEPSQLVIRRNGELRDITVSPRAHDRMGGMLVMGVSPAYELRAVEPRQASPISDEQAKLLPPDLLAVRPGEVITQVEGRDVKVDDFMVLDAAFQSGNGRPVTITVKGVDGTTRQEKITPRLQGSFDADTLDFAGMLPRAAIEMISSPSTDAAKVLKPGDVVLKIAEGVTPRVAYSIENAIEDFHEAGKRSAAIKITVLRDGKPMEVGPITPNVSLGDGKRGIGVRLMADTAHAVVGGTAPGGAAERAGVAPGTVILAAQGKPVERWDDVLAVLRTLKPGEKLSLDTELDGVKKTYALDLSQAELASAANQRYGHDLTMMTLRRLEILRKTDSLATAAWWGVEETRDLTLKFYVTLQRMAGGTVPAKNLMGPIGMLQTGSLLAWRGPDWLLWFLAMISANLAVVNFLPIPIVDGGLFTFLLLEKLTGRPPSPRVQNIAQMAGLLLIAGLFIFVTYNDIMRML